MLVADTPSLRVVVTRRLDRLPRQLGHPLQVKRVSRIPSSPSANLRAAALRGDAELLRAAERLFHENRSDADPSSTDLLTVDPMIEGPREPD